MYELFEAAVDATAESVVNSLCAAHTTEGRDAQVAYALPLDRLVDRHAQVRARGAARRTGHRPRPLPRLASGG